MIETDNADLLARKISKLKQDEQKRVKYFLSLFGIETAPQAVQTQDTIKTGNLAVAAENALKTPVNAPQAATDATGLRIFWRNEARYYAGETCAAAVVTSLPVFTKTQPTDEEGVHYTATQAEAVEWCSAAYSKADNPFAVISQRDGEKAEVYDTYATAAAANQAARARLGGKGAKGKNKLVFGCTGKEYVAAVPFAVFAATPALRCTGGELYTYAQACAKIAAQRPADAYGINFKETAKNGRVFVDIYNYV